MNLWRVRHAQPQVASGVCYGLSDLPADPAATLKAAQALAQVLPVGTHVISSPLQRCELLTKYLRGLRPDLTPIFDIRLVEMDFGSWEGQRWDAIDRQALDAWATQFATWRCGGGECVQEVMDRVAAVWDASVAVAQASGESVCWITHAGVIRAATLIAQGVRQVSDAAQWPKEAPGFGQWWGP